MNQRAVIFGATSAIAIATTRILSDRGYHLTLVGRDGDKLEDLSKEYIARGSVCEIAVCDFSDLTDTLSTLKVLPKDPDLVLIAHGTLPEKQEEVIADPVALQSVTNINFLSSAVIACHYGRELSLLPRKKRTVAIISSVAGDRGRASNYLYGSLKSAVSALTSGLRQAYRGAEINFLTIKPGMVSSPMTKNFKKGPLFSPPESVAADIVKAIDTASAVVYSPFYWRIIMGIILAIPEGIFKRLKF
jgi:short-subunit dehydrogenase